MKYPIAAAALLLPMAALAQDVSRHTSLTAVTPPPQAVAAGFTTTLVNQDFSRGEVDLGCAGASQKHFWNQGLWYELPYVPPCSQISMVQDQGQSVLDLRWLSTQTDQYDATTVMSLAGDYSQYYAYNHGYYEAILRLTPWDLGGIFVDWWIWGANDIMYRTAWPNNDGKGSTANETDLVELHSELPTTYLAATHEYYTSIVSAVQGAADNGSGLIRLTVPNTVGLSNDMEVTTGDIAGTVEANGSWFVTVIDTTHFDLQGSSFKNAYTGGGYWYIDKLGGYGANIPVQPASWNFWDKGSNINLSKEDMTATINVGGGPQVARSTSSQSSGKRYFELNCDQASGGWNGGLANYWANLSYYMGGDPNSVAYVQDQRFIHDSFMEIARGWDGCVTGDRVGIAVDLDNALIYARTYHNGVWGENWNATTEAQPASGGYNLGSSMVSNPNYIAWEGYNSGEAGTVYVSSATGAIGPLPNGYSWWDSSGLSVPIDYTQYHKFGMLWTRGPIYGVGKACFYLDDVQMGCTDMHSAAEFQRNFLMLSMGVGCQYVNGWRSCLNVPVTGVGDNGSGAVRLSIGTTEGFSTGQQAKISGVGGVPSANGTFRVTVVDGAHLDLEGSTFSGSYSSGGTVNPLTQADMYVKSVRVWGCAADAIAGC